MLLKQRCLVVILLDLKCPLIQISRRFGLSLRDITVISNNIDIVRTANISQYNKNCLEITDFTAKESKLRLIHIKILLHRIIQQFSRWARQASHLDKSYGNKINVHCSTTEIKVGNEFILQVWLWLKNLILHHPTVPYDKIYQRALNLTFLQHSKLDLAGQLIGTSPARSYLMTALGDLTSRKHLEFYFF